MTQPINQDVLNLLKNKGKASQPPEVEKVKSTIAQLIQQYNVPIDLVISVGQLAKKAITDPQMYQMLVQKAVQSKLISPDQIQSGQTGMDYKLIAGAITIGKLAEQLKNEGM